MDLEALVEQLEEVREYLFQLMVQKPHSNTLDMPYAVIGEVVEEMKGAIPDEE